MGALGAAVRVYGPPAALLAALVGLWELGVRVFDVPDYLLPAPHQVAEDLRAEHGMLLAALALMAGIVVRRWGGGRP